MEENFSSRQAVVRQSSGSRQAVVRQSSGSRQRVRGLSSRMQDESIDETGVRGEPEDSYNVTGVQPRDSQNANSEPEKEV